MLKYHMPDKFSDMVTQALADIQQYDVDMEAWITPADNDPNKICAVCLGGAILANHVEGDIESWIDEYIDGHVPDCPDNRALLRRNILLLDAFRQALFVEMLQDMPAEWISENTSIHEMEEIDQKLLSALCHLTGEDYPPVAIDKFTKIFSVMDRGSPEMTFFIEVATGLNQVLIKEGL